MKKLFLRLKEWLFLNSEANKLSSSSDSDVRSLLTMAQTIPFNFGLEETMSFLLNEFQKSFPVKCGIIMLEEDNHFRVISHRFFSAFVIEKIQDRGEQIVNESYSLQKKIILDAAQISKFPELAHIAENEGWNSLCLLPLTIQTQVLGIFLAGSEKKNYFSDNIVVMMDHFIQVICVGIRNSLLSEKMEKFNRRLEAEVMATTEELTKTNQRLIRRVWELKSLYEITSLAASSASLEHLCEAVIPKVKELFEAEYAGILLKGSNKDSSIELLSQCPSFGLPKEFHKNLCIQSSKVHDTLLPIIEAVKTCEAKYFSGKVVNFREAFFIDLNSPFSKSLENMWIRSCLALPLRSSQKSLGVLLLLNASKGSDLSPSAERLSYSYNEENVRTLSLIAGQISSAIENLQLSLESQRRLADLSALSEIGDVFYSKPIFKYDLEKMCSIVLNSFSCDSCAFYFYEPESGNLVVRNNASAERNASKPEQEISLKSEKNVLIQTFLNGKSMIVETPPVESLSHQSLLLVSLKADNEVFGVLQLTKNEKSFFNENHLRLAELIASRVTALEQNVKLYEKILQANKELERLNKVKTDFVSMVSHELRTPVTAIKGFVDVVMSEDAGPINDQQKRFLGIAHNSIDRLTLLIADLLDLSRIESGQLKMEMAETNLEKILKDAAETYRATIESKGISFKTETDKKLPRFLGDEARIKQVIDNLLSNAMKFTPNGGSIHISADDMGDFIMTSVSDTGMGIKKENQEKIFEKFFQVDSSLTRHVGGTGLGLSICKSIVEMHSGRIWVESEFGKGSVFRFLLPRIRMQKQMNYKESGGEKMPYNLEPSSVPLKSDFKKNLKQNDRKRN